MIRTLRSVNGAPARLGNLQTQPVTDDPDYNVKRASTVAGSPSSAPVPAYQAGIDATTLAYDGSDLIVGTNSSIIDVANSLVNDDEFMLPSFQSKVNQVMPSNAPDLEPVAPTNTRAIDASLGAAKKQKTVEALTGLSSERPEIVMLTNFSPLFTKDVGQSKTSFTTLIENSGLDPLMTDAGRYVDTQIHAKNLRYIDMVNLLRELRLRYAHVHSTFSDRRRSFEKHIDTLKDDAGFLLDLVQTLGRLKQHLDLHDDVHTVNPQLVLREFLLDSSSQLDAITSGLSTQVSSPDVTGTDVVAQSPSLDFVKKWLPATYPLADVLVSLGYKKEIVSNRFASTKMWLQMLLEMKDVLKQHSLWLLDINPVTQRNDVSPTVINHSKAKLFDLSIAHAGLPLIQDIVSTPLLGVQTTADTITSAWGAIYSGIHFKSVEARIAACVNAVSKDVRYSVGLSQPNVQNMLLNQFSYQVQPSGNIAMWDALIGNVGHNITSFQSNGELKSMVAIAQRQVSSDHAVLTFESKYVDAGSDTLEPGGAYYVDSALKTDGKTFNVSKVDILGDVFEDAHSRFSAAVTGLNLLELEVSSKINPVVTQYTSVISNPADFIRNVVGNVADLKTGVTYPFSLDDVLGGVYSYATTTKGNRIKSLLFMFTMLKMERSYLTALNPFFAVIPVDNTPVIDKVIDLLMLGLEHELLQTPSGNKLQVNPQTGTLPAVNILPGDAIRSAFKSSTRLTRFIATTMKNVLTTLAYNDQGMADGRMRYSKDNATIIMMTIFDAIIHMIGKFNNQQLVAVNAEQDQGVRFFTVVRSFINNKASIDALLTKIDKEIALNQKLVFTVLHTLRKLSQGFKNCSNLLKAKSSLDKLHQISRIVDDPRMLDILMNEQQIMLLSSTVFDLVDRIAQPASNTGTGDVDKDGNFDADDEIKILDDSVPFPRLRNAVYGFFGTERFASKRGANKRILTVGLPHGFSRRFKQEVNVKSKKKSSFIDKQDDIIQLVVYKVDLVNSDIVYKPRRFLFELSRFPVRNDRYFLTIPDKATLDDIIGALPTRDFGQDFATGQNVDYYVRNDEGAPNGQNVAFAGDTYSFLTHREKAELARNHVSSYMLETYVRLLTGVSLADYHFDMVNPAPRPVEKALVKLVTEHHIARIAEKLGVSNKSPAENQPPTGGVMFSNTSSPAAGYTSSGQTPSPSASVTPQQGNSTGVAGDVSLTAQLAALSQLSQTPLTVEQQKVIGSMEKNLSKISHRNIPVILHGLRTVSTMSRTVMPASDPRAVSKRILSPKQFDRVFNVVVDPDDFEIDHDKTVKTPYGKQALDQLITTGEVLVSDENQQAQQYLSIGDLTVPSGARSFVQNRAAPTINAYRHRKRDRQAGDLTFEKYFVTVETFGKDEV